MQDLDQLTVDTPEQITLELPLAGAGSRMLALFVDTLLQAAAAVLAVVVFLFAEFMTAAGWLRSFVGGLAPALLVLFLFCVYWGYFAFFEAVWKGRTPGKRYAGIRVIKASGRPINTFESIARNLMRAMDALPGFYGVGVLTMALNRQNRRLGDFVAGTVVVHEQATERVQPSLWANGAADASVTAIGDLTADELLLVETYLARRFELDALVRDETAGRIALRICRRAGLAEPPPAPRPDALLQALAKRTRDGARFR